MSMLYHVDKSKLSAVSSMVVSPLIVIDESGPSSKPRKLRTSAMTSDDTDMALSMRLGRTWR